MLAISEKNVTMLRTVSYKRYILNESYAGQSCICMCMVAKFKNCFFRCTWKFFAYRANADDVC